MSVSLTDLIFIALVAAGAFYAGFQFGRLKTLAEGGGTGRRNDDQPPLSGPLEGPLDEASAGPTRPRGAPPPASSGSDETWERRAPPRRSSKPPPAAAGLMGTGAAEKPGTRQK